MLDIHAAMVVINAYGFKSGNTIEVEKALKDFEIIFNILFITQVHYKVKQKDALILVKKLQHIASLMSIALRPMLMAKELTVGLFKNAAFFIL